MVETHVFLVISVFSLNLTFLLSSSLLPWLIFAFKFAGVEVKFCNLRRMHVWMQSDDKQRIKKNKNTVSIDFWANLVGYVLLYYSNSMVVGGMFV
ncbi:hypothetical protein Peur_019202 [Populus x canadensis]